LTVLLLTLHLQSMQVSCVRVILVPSSFLQAVYHLNSTVIKQLRCRKVNLSPTEAFAKSGTSPAGSRQAPLQSFTCECQHSIAKLIA